MMACPDVPEAPLKNVYGATTAKPSFTFRFDCDTTGSGWDASQGYGRFSSQLKYFDSTIAFRHLADDLRPEAVVEVAPFRLEVFDYCRSFVSHLRTAIESVIHDLGSAIDTDVALLSAQFANIPNESKKAVTLLATGDFSALELAVSGFLSPTAEEMHSAEEATNRLARLHQASTEDGLRVLKSELAALRRLQQSISTLLSLFTKDTPDQYRRLIAELRLKKATQRSIAQDILPNGVALDRFKAFLDSATSVFSFPGNEDDPCPFCRRPLDANAIHLVTRYHAFLVNTLQQQVAQLVKDVGDAADTLETIRDFSIVLDETITPLLHPDKCSEIAECVKHIKGAIPTPLSREDEPTFGTFDRHAALAALLKYVAEEADKRDIAIKAEAVGKENRQNELSQLTAQCGKYAFRAKLHEHLDDVKPLLAKFKYRQGLKELVATTDFPTILRRMTNAGKDAHSELVVGEFEKMLDKEYMALSGKHLTDFGIRLVPRGQQQEVSVQTHIGDTPMQRVLSEGEQKVHALAMFFCEAMARPCDVFVFDDPSTSFDYNYSASFVERLRDLAIQCPQSQLIVFTHNWDFFVQVQVAFNKAALNNHLTVKVLEHCAIVESYSEKLDELHSEVQAMLALPGDFDAAQRERISGLLRRAIEAVVNRYVFNNQRHQFKQRSQSVSVFDEFVRLVPLNEAEAQKLSDLYGHLSVSEHDDPRNQYVGRNKASFKKWYDEITAVESSLKARRP